MSTLSQRWEVPDPSDAQSYNRFAYVQNRPLVLTDPTGHGDEQSVFGDLPGTSPVADVPDDASGAIGTAFTHSVSFGGPTFNQFTSMASTNLADEQVTANTLPSPAETIEIAATGTGGGDTTGNGPTKPPECNAQCGATLPIINVTSPRLPLLCLPCFYVTGEALYWVAGGVAVALGIKAHNEIIKQQKQQPVTNGADSETAAQNDGDQTPAGKNRNNQDQGDAAKSGDRSGKDFTIRGRRRSIGRMPRKTVVQMFVKTADKMSCPSKNQKKDVTPPDNERQRDHIIPKSQGGAGDPSNGQILCRDCNPEKSDN